MDKTIVLVSYYFPPLNEIACLRTGQWAKFLASPSRKVIVVTAKKSIADGAMNLSINLPDSVTVIEVEFAPKWLINLIVRLRGNHSGKSGWNESTNPSGLWRGQVWLKRTAKRVFRFISRYPGSLFDYRIMWAKKAAKRLRELQAERNINCIVSSYGPAASHLAVYWALKGARRNVKWILDYRDPWVGSHITSARFPFSLIEKNLQKDMLKGYADALTTVSEELARQLALQAPGIPVRVIKNGIDISRYRETKAGVFANDWATTKGVFPGLQNGQFRIVYTGMIYQKNRDPSPLFKAIHKLQNRTPLRINVEFYGKPGDLFDVINSERASAFAKHNGVVSHDEALVLQSNADLLLILETDSPDAIGVLTGKIFEYMASGRPIIAIGIGTESPIGRLLESTGAGEALGNDVENIERRLDSYIRHRRHPAYTLTIDELELFSRERQVKKLVELIDEDIDMSKTNSNLHVA